MESDSEHNGQIPRDPDDTAEGVVQQRKYESVAESMRHDANECCWESSRQVILAASVLLAVTGTFFTQPSWLDRLCLWARIGVLFSWVFHLTSMVLGCWLFLSEERFFTRWTEFFGNVAAKYSDNTVSVSQTSENTRVEAQRLPRSSPRGPQLWQVGLFLVGCILDVVVFAALIL